MQYFTPELVVRFNSADDAEADAAQQAWDDALVAYRKRARAIRDRLPSSVRKLAKLCLHDAEWRGCEPSAASGFPAIAVLTLAQDGRDVSLIYVLRDRIRTRRSRRQWPFSKLRPHWLYDELDLDPVRAGGFLHRILLSDGRVLEIPFVTATVHDPSSSRSRADAAAESVA